MNRALTSDREWQDHKLPLYKAAYQLLVLLLAQNSLSATKYAVLQPDCGVTYNVQTEKRKHAWVEYYTNALSIGIDLDTILDVTACELGDPYGATNVTPPVLTRAKATLSTNLAGENNDLVFTARNYGSFGNVLSIQYVDPAANDQALSVSVVGTAIKVSLATGAGPGGAITSTATLIKAAIESNASATSLVAVALKASNSGAGVVTVLAATNLAGGLD